MPAGGKAAAPGTREAPAANAQMAAKEAAEEAAELTIPAADWPAEASAAGEQELPEAASTPEAPEETAAAASSALQTAGSLAAAAVASHAIGGVQLMHATDLQRQVSAPGIHAHTPCACSC